MAATDNETVATHEVDGRSFHVVACWDSDTPDGTYEFYDVHDAQTGECLNEGEPYDDLPSRDDVAGDAAHGTDRPACDGPSVG